MNKYPIAAKTSLKNQFFVSLPTLYYLSSNIQKSVELSIDDNFIVSVWKVFLIVNVSNLLFYWCHRFLHLQFMFRYVHSKHHEFIDPVGVAALFAHPIEHLLANTLSFILPFVYLGTNYKIMLWLLALSSSIPVFYHSRSFNFFNDHLVHHQTFKYNFGFGGYLDKLFGTYRE
jgi:methylsterol monooxygenase